jgi:hypothetical protein
MNDPHVDQPTRRARRAARFEPWNIALEVRAFGVGATICASAWGPDVGLQSL